MGPDPQSKVRGNSSLNTFQQVGQPIIHNHIHVPSHSSHYSPHHTSPPSHYHRHGTPLSSSTHTLTRQCFQQTQSSLIVLEPISWAEFDGDGLGAFIAHCEKKFKVGSGIGFQEAYLKLRDHEIQLDVMRQKTVEWYEAMEIKREIAERIIRTFGKWYARLLQDT